MSYLIYLDDFDWLYIIINPLIKPKFDQVNSAIKVNLVLCGSTRYLHFTWFYIFVIVGSELEILFDRRLCVLTTAQNAS